MDHFNGILIWTLWLPFVSILVLAKLPRIIAWLRNVELPAGCSVHDPTGASAIPDWFVALWHSFTLKSRAKLGSDKKVNSWAAEEDKQRSDQPPNTN